MKSRWQNPPFVKPPCRGWWQNPISSANQSSRVLGSRMLVPFLEFKVAAIGRRPLQQRYTKDCSNRPTLTKLKPPQWRAIPATYSHTWMLADLKGFPTVKHGPRSAWQTIPESACAPRKRGDNSTNCHKVVALCFHRRESRGSNLELPFSNTAIFNFMFPGFWRWSCEHCGYIYDFQCANFYFKSPGTQARACLDAKVLFTHSHAFLGYPPGWRLCDCQHRKKHICTGIPVPAPLIGMLPIFWLTLHDLSHLRSTSFHRAEAWNTNLHKTLHTRNLWNNQRTKKQTQKWAKNTAPNICTKISAPKLSAKSGVAGIRRPKTDPKNRCQSCANPESWQCCAVICECFVWGRWGGDSVFSQTL